MGQTYPNKTPIRPGLKLVADRTWPGDKLFVGLILFAVGAVIFWFVMCNPIYRLILSSEWKVTPCKVLSFKVNREAKHSEVALSYEYAVGDKRYVSNQYDLQQSIQGLPGDYQVDRPYSIGERTTCYVDPQDSSKAVLSRKLRNSFWAGVIPAVFVLWGMAVIVQSVGHWFRPRLVPVIPSDTPTDFLPSFHEEARMIRLQGSSSMPSRKELEDLPNHLRNNATHRLLAVVYAGQAMVLLVASGYFFSLSYQHPSRWDIPIRILLITMGIVALWRIRRSFQKFRMSLNPVPTVMLQPSVIRPGATIELRWTFPKSKRKISHLAISLQAVEYSSSGNGDDEMRQVSMELPILQTDSPQAIAMGVANITIPAMLPPSLNMLHNGLRWRISFHSVIPGYPDLVDDYDVVVLPAKWPDRLYARRN